MHELLQSATAEHMSTVNENERCQPMESKIAPHKREKQKNQQQHCRIKKRSPRVTQFLSNEEKTEISTIAQSEWMEPNEMNETNLHTDTHTTQERNEIWTARRKVYLAKSKYTYTYTPITISIRMKAVDAVVAVTGINAK